MDVAVCCECFAIKVSHSTRGKRDATPTSVLWAYFPYCFKPTGLAIKKRVTFFSKAVSDVPKCHLPSAENENQLNNHI